MFIKRIQLNNLLSFGPDTEALELRPLNVLIGPNGSGKSNLIEAIGLLKATPKDLTAPIREGGGIRDWIWRGDPRVSSAHIEVIIDNPRGSALRYRLGFSERGQQFELIDGRESLVNIKVFVEGGGETKALRTKCREGFSKFFSKAGMEGRKTRSPQRQRSEATTCGSHLSTFWIRRSKSQTV